MLKWVEVNELRLGMYVQLDLGWLSHPFPLSRFRLSSADDLSKLKRLGVARVQVDVALSDPRVFDAMGNVMDTPTQAPVSDSQLPPLDSQSAQQAWAQSALKRQKQEFQAREVRHAKAMANVRQLLAQVNTHPADAAEGARDMVQSLLQDMGGAQDVRVCLLSDQTGDGVSLHALNVSVLALLLARSMSLSEDELLAVGVGALFHDIGKSELSAALRLPNKQFTAVQTRAYQSHVDLGVVLARKMQLTDAAIAVVAQHHEAQNGTGYPRGLRGEHITVPAKVVSLVNAFDNLCNPGQRSAALTPHEALSHVYAQDAARHDLASLRALVHRLGVYPPGSLVQLSDERFAMVMAINEGHPLKPQLLVHGSAETDGPTVPGMWIDLRDQPGLTIRRSVPARLLPPSAAALLCPRLRVSYFFDRYDPLPDDNRLQAWSMPERNGDTSGAR